MQTGQAPQRAHGQAAQAPAEPGVGGQARARAAQHVQQRAHAAARAQHAPPAAAVLPLGSAGQADVLRGG